MVIASHPSRRGKRKGAVLLLSMILLVLVLVLVAFAVDVGYLMCIRNQAQRCADAGLGDLTLAGLEKAESAILAAADTLASLEISSPSHAQQPDGEARPLLQQELGWVVEMLRFACRLGRARLASGVDRPLGAIPADERRALATRLGNREELWFNECAQECYLPLIRLLDRLNSDHVSGRITLSLSPTLIAMMRDPLVNERLAEQAVGVVQSLRRLDLKKNPSVSETIDWAKALVMLNADSLDKQTLETTLTVLLKHESDVQKAKRALGDDDQPGRPRGRRSGRTWN